MLECLLVAEGPESNPKTATLHLKGSATIPWCGQMREALLEALHKCRTVVVDVTEIESIDVSGLQLLCSAHKSALQQKKAISLSGRRSDAFSAQARDTGYVCSLSGTCRGDEGELCLWTESEQSCGGGRP